ncbi:MAG TPA: M15 family metallopeptidase [Bryobacteraceae bacterium]|nr:M15 family metallopeptidase [Bryobacteraceae bacterium]
MDTPDLTLIEKQHLFCQLAANLILEAIALGYQPRFGEAYRTPEQAELDAQKGTGIKNSEHCKRLALDLILDKDGVWLTNSNDYKPLGEWWKQQHPLCRWGGDFQSNPDGNHFSLFDQGVA